MSKLLLDAIEKSKTYSLLKWHYRSAEHHDPYILASQGYECVDLNTVECAICHNRVAFTTRDGVDRAQEEVDRELAAHDSTCEHYGEPGRHFTRADLYVGMDDIVKNVKEHYKNSQDKKLYPLINYKKITDCIAANGQSSIFNTVLNKNKIDPGNVKIPFILTLLGWKKKSLEELECDFCGRVVNIKEFKITTEDSQKVSDFSYSEPDLFDPVDEHRYFCFWVHGVVGWEVFVQHLYDLSLEVEDIFKDKLPFDQAKKIRVLIDGYLQKFENLTSESFDKALKVLEQCTEMVQSIEQNQEISKSHAQIVVRRRAEARKFFQTIDNEIKKPLKRVKLD